MQRGLLEGLVIGPNTPVPCEARLLNPQEQIIKRDVLESASQSPRCAALIDAASQR